MRFTAGQAAQKLAISKFARFVAFTAGQAAQKISVKNGAPLTAVHCRTGSSERVAGVDRDEYAHKPGLSTNRREKAGYDHSLESIDPDYPVFVLSFCIFRKDEYAGRVAPAIRQPSNDRLTVKDGKAKLSLGTTL